MEISAGWFKKILKHTFATHQSEFMSGLFTRTSHLAGKIILGGICFYTGIILGSLVSRGTGIFQSAPASGRG
jgi:hypothetical protein